VLFSIAINKRPLTSIGNDGLIWRNFVIGRAVLAMALPSEEEVLDDVSSAWRLQRIKCLIVFVLQLFALAIDESIVTTLMPKYIKLATTDTANTTGNSALLVISSGVATIVFQIILGRYADKTRRTVRFLVVCNSCAVIGNIIYSIPYGIYVLVIGRFIRGIGTSAFVIVIGEVARSYVPKDLCRAISMCLMGTIMGELIGPIAAKSYHNIDFMVAKLHIRHPNAMTLLTSGIFLLVLVLTLMLASDLSSDFDLKANYYEILNERQRKDEICTTLTDDDSPTQESPKNESSLLFDRKVSAASQTSISNENCLTTSLQLLRNVVTLVILFASCVLAHSESLFWKYATKIARRKVNIDFHYNSVLTTLGVLTKGATFLLVGSIGEKIGDVALVFASFALVILSVASWLIMEVLTSERSAMLSFFVIAFAAICMSSCGEIALRVLMAKLVPSCMQSYSEAFRLCFATFGAKFADLLHVAELSSPLICGTIIAGVNVVTIAVVNMNYQYLVDPAPLIQIKSRKCY